MCDQAIANVAKEETNAMKATADENVREIHKEFDEILDDSDDEVVVSTSKPERVLATPTTNSNNNVKKETPEMNIQLQR